MTCDNTATPISHPWSLHLVVQSLEQALTPPSASEPTSPGAPTPPEEPRHVSSAYISMQACTRIVVKQGRQPPSPKSESEACPRGSKPTQNDLALLDRARAGCFCEVEGDADIKSEPLMTKHLPKKPSATQFMSYPTVGLSSSCSPTLTSTPKGLEGAFCTGIHMLMGRSRVQLSPNPPVASSLKVQAPPGGPSPTPP